MPSNSSNIQRENVESMSENGNFIEDVVIEQDCDNDVAVDEWDRNANFTEFLLATLNGISPNTEYIACINCWFPIAYRTSIIDCIYSSRFPEIPIGYVLLNGVEIQWSKRTQQSVIVLPLEKRHIKNNKVF